MKEIHSLIVYGDSISTLEYPEMLRKLLNADRLVNHAIGASALTRGTYCSTTELLDDPANLHSDADIVILWHGTNDWYWGAEPGHAKSTDDRTFCGAIRNAVNKIRDASPSCRIIYPTPLLRVEAPDRCTEKKEAFGNPNKAGYTQKAYYDAIMEMSREMTFCVEDLRTETNFSIQSMPLYLPDGVHPNTAGCEIIANILANRIKQLYL